MNKASAVMSWLLFTAASGGQPSAPAAKPAASPDALQAEINALRPADHVWRAIAWKTCALDALATAGAQNKPIIAWVFLGVPADERC